MPAAQHPPAPPGPLACTLQRTITFVTIANVFSVRMGAGIQNIATSAKVFALAAIIGVLFGAGDGTHGALASGVRCRP